MQNSDAITATVVAIVSAIAGVIVSAGLPLSKDLTDHILVLISVVTPVVILGVAWLHHSNAKIVAAEKANGPAARVNL